MYSAKRSHSRQTFTIYDLGSDIFVLEPNEVHQPLIKIKCPSTSPTNRKTSTNSFLPYQTTSKRKGTLSSVKLPKDFKPIQKTSESNAANNYHSGQHAASPEIEQAQNLQGSALTARGDGVIAAGSNQKVLGVKVISINEQLPMRKEKTHRRSTSDIFQEKLLKKKESNTHHANKLHKIGSFPPETKSISKNINLQLEPPQSQNDSEPAANSARLLRMKQRRLNSLEKKTKEYIKIKTQVLDKESTSRDTPLPDVSPVDEEKYTSIHKDIEKEKSEVPTGILSETLEQTVKNPSSTTLNNFSRTNSKNLPSMNISLERDRQKSLSTLTLKGDYEHLISHRRIIDTLSQEYRKIEKEKNKRMLKKSAMYEGFCQEKKQEIGEPDLANSYPNPLMIGEMKINQIKHPNHTLFDGNTQYKSETERLSLERPPRNAPLLPKIGFLNRQESSETLKDTKHVRVKSCGNLSGLTKCLGSDKRNVGVIIPSTIKTKREETKENNKRVEEAKCRKDLCDESMSDFKVEGWDYDTKGYR